MVIRISPREFFIRKLEEQKPLKEEPKERVEEKVEYLPPTLEYGHQQPKEIIKEIPVPVKAEDGYEPTQREFTRFFPILSFLFNFFPRIKALREFILRNFKFR